MVFTGSEPLLSIEYQDKEIQKLNQSKLVKAVIDARHIEKTKIDNVVITPIGYVSSQRSLEKYKNIND